MAILIDEGNAMQQLQQVGIHGLKRWKSFYHSIESRLKADFHDDIEVSYHFYGSLPPKHYDRNRYFDRKDSLIDCLSMELTSIKVYVY